PEHLLCYGRLDVYQKGLDVLLEAYGRLRSRLPSPPRLVIAGRGDRDRVAAAVAASGLEGIRLEAPVDRDRVLALMGRAHALLMPSRFEGFPVVPLEAMAAGLPVIATSVGGLAEIVPGDAGVLIPPEDAGALTDAMTRLLGDPAALEVMSERGRRAASRFTWDRVAARHAGFLEAVAGAG
ncbi:MAG: glycosyltransferase, partial [Gemmatimonadetes bacterium]|nr:glycosyltransferase family 4 protein [Gemmatimonadota bacterium]NIQ58986.1 glycosyltransferase family 4 protein [Gemmatimonadota bacterium]NIU79193.1 glycosyltransferase [Gammaproteobacteria bacterium]NIX47876.1 glycosyltransferase [Gemmatimonadota bacterium]NIY12247.1 glycosyltransferase [Gemmatimonadota bacterium]